MNQEEGAESGGNLNQRPKIKKQPSDEPLMYSETPSDIRHLSSEYVDQIMSSVELKQENHQKQ